jgi:hypothetical protein
MAAGTDKSKVRVAVVGDASQLEKELRKAEAQLGRFGDNAKKSGDILRSAVFGGAVLYGAKRLVDAAGDLQQSIGGTTAVFEDAAGAVSDFTKNAADLVGMSENAARTITSKLGASLKGFGMSTEEAAKQSINLTTIGADLAATLGGKTEDAVAALGSALRGEYDPLEAFGIALKASEVNAKAVSMGLASSESNVTAYAKGQATLALITERSAFAQGQFAREADTAQGQAQRAAAKTQDASAKLGESLLPIYTKIQEGIGSVADAFTALPDSVQTGLLALTGVAFVAKPAADAFVFMTSAIRGIPDIFNRMADRAIASAGGLDAAATKANRTVKEFGKFSVAAIGVFAVAEGIKAIIAAQADFGSTDVERITASLRTFATDNVGGVLAEDIGKLRNAIKSLDSASGSFNQLKLGFSQYVEKGETDKARQAIEAVDTALKSLFQEDPTAAGTAYQKLLDDLGISADKGAKLFDGYAGAVDDAQLSTDNLVDPVEAATTALKDEAVEAEKAAKKLKDLYDATSNLFGANISLEEAQINTRKALEEYNKSLSDGSLTADERQQIGLDLLKAFQNESEAAVEAAAAQALLEGKTLTSGEAAGIQAGKYFELAETLAPDSPLRKRLTDLGTQLYLLSLQKPVVKIDVEAEEAQRKIRELLGLSETLKGSLSGVGVRFPAGRATGGPVDSGTPYIVGEQGPELFVPSSYGRIMDAFSTNKALLSNAGGGMGFGGSNITINVTVSPTADKAAIGQTLVEAISAYERRSGDGWRS